MENKIMKIGISKRHSLESGIKGIPEMDHDAQLLKEFLKWPELSKELNIVINITINGDYMAQKRKRGRPKGARYRDVDVRKHERTLKTGEKVPVTKHQRKVLKKEVGRSGKKFDKLQKEVADQYRGKPVPKKRQKQVLEETGRPLGKTYDDDEAEAIGTRVAGKTFWRRFGKKGGSEILQRER